MSTAPRLLANLGAEEGEAGIAAAARPGSEAAILAELWRGLFDPPAFSWLEGVEAAAWWNDERAEREVAGLKLSGAGSAIVRRLHDKAWAVNLAREERLEPPMLRGLVTVLEPEELQGAGAADRISEVLAGWPEWAQERFTLKPRIGTSGRGRVAGQTGQVNDAMRAALARLAASGGAVLEPWLDRIADASAQLHIADDGVVTLLGTLQIVTTPSGQPRGHRGELDSRGRPRTGLDEEEALREAGGIAGVNAAAAGYRGPCGIDAFAFRSAEDGHRCFRPLVEFNARFTSGTVALGQIRRNLPRIKAELGLAPGELFHFYVGRGGAGLTSDAEAGTLVVPLLGGIEAAEDGPVLLVARNREVVDAWLSVPQGSA